jgi:Carboxypeptidase regulatory-like domain
MLRACDPRPFGSALSEHLVDFIRLHVRTTLKGVCVDTPVALLLLLFFPFRQSEQTSDLSGVVRLTQGLGIAGASVTADCTNKVGSTDERGAFVLPGVTAGCVLKIRADGFAPSSYTVVDPEEPIEISMNLDLLRQTVTVVDSSHLTNTNPELSTAIDTRTMTALPSLNRDINRFAMLDPRVRNTGSLSNDGIYGTRLTVNGQLFRFTQYRLDGLSNYEPALGNGPQQVPPTSSVAEYKIVAGQFSAEYGRSGAGIISAVTRTGGDQWHGEAFYILRPSGIQAAPPVSTFRVPNERQLWGGAAGGPLSPTVHVFASLEGNQQTRSAYIQSPQPSFFPGHQHQWFTLLNVDKQWSNRQSFYLRLNGHSTAGDNANDAVGGFNQASAARRDSGQNAGLQGTHRWVTGSASTNELRIAVSKNVPLSFYSLHPQTQIVRPSYSTEGLSDFGDTRVLTWQASEVFAWHRKGHEVRLGADFIRNKVRDFSGSIFGSYRMPAGPPRPAESPLQYTQTFGAAPVRYGDTLTSWFMHDDWKSRENLTFNLGLRYDYQSTTRDPNNLAPRLGFAWDPGGTGRTVVRGGAGIFYDQVFLQPVRGELQQGPGSLQATYTIPFGSAGFPSFPQSLGSPPSGSGDRRDLAIYSSHRLNPYTGEFTLGLQRVLGEDWTLSLNASYSVSQKQLRVLDLNAPSPFFRTAPGQRRSAAVADASRPYSRYATIPVRVLGLFENTGTTRYAAFDVQIAKRFTRRFQAMGHYLNSFSSVTDVFFTGGPNTGIPSDWGNPGSAERGPTDFYQRHRIAAEGFAELPFNFQVSAFLIAGSGLPVNPLTGVDNNGDSNVVDRPPGTGRNSFRAPYESTLDISVLRRFGFRRYRLETRVEVTNLLNRSNFLRVNAIYGDGARPVATFLQPIAGLTNTNPGRQVQSSLRFTF